MGVVSRLKKKGIIKDDELEKDKKKREESLKKSQEELPKASEFRNSLKTSKKTEREEDSDNWFQEKNKSKKLKRVNSNSTLPTKSDFIRKVAKTAVEEGKKTTPFLTRATANIAGFGVDAGLTLRNAEETVMEAAPMTWQWANRKAKELEKSSSSDKVQEFLMRNYELNDYLNQGSTQYDNINKEKQKALDDLVNHGTGLANLKEEDKNTLKSEIMQIMNKHENISMNNSDANTRGEQLDEITKTIEKYMGLNYYDNVVDKTQNVVNTIEEEKQKNVDYATSDLGKKSVEVLEKIYPEKGREYTEKIRDYTIALYKKCAEYALTKGIIIADTKFEFGLNEQGEVVLADEMLTPDSSRFWPLDGYKPGQGQPSFDKQYVRDWLKANPDNDLLLPDEVVVKTVEKYKEAFELLTGSKFSR